MGGCGLHTPFGGTDPDRRLSRRSPGTPPRVLYRRWPVCLGLRVVRPCTKPRATDRGQGTPGGRRSPPCAELFGHHRRLFRGRAAWQGDRHLDQPHRRNADTGPGPRRLPGRERLLAGDLLYQHTPCGCGSGDHSLARARESGSGGQEAGSAGRSARRGGLGQRRLWAPGVLEGRLGEPAGSRISGYRL